MAITDEGSILKRFNNYLVYDQLIERIKEYLASFNGCEFPDFSNQSILEIITGVKRKSYDFGPYKGLTFYETMNRVGSDLVLMEGARQLFINRDYKLKYKTKAVKMVLSNMPGFDLSIQTEQDTFIDGEGFNAAPSFAKTKLRSAIKNLLDGKQIKNTDTKASANAIILMNSEIKDIIDNYKNQRLVLLNNIDFIFCDVSELWKI